MPLWQTPLVAFTQDNKPFDDREKGTFKLRYEPARDEMAVIFTGASLDKRPNALPKQPELTGHAQMPLKFLCMEGPTVQPGRMRPPQVQAAQIVEQTILLDATKGKK